MILGNVPGDTFQERLSTWLMGMQQPSESDTEFDGVLSYATELHAVVIGFTTALALGLPGLAAVVITALAWRGSKRITNRKAIRELQREPWYGLGGGLIGFGLNHYYLGNTVIDHLPILF